ncbi:MAG: O-antigen ligase family protein [Flavobacteriales bacterium]|nr:O-antigen ligase family protein [Flavobacteriales bacterium]
MDDLKGYRTKFGTAGQWSWLSLCALLPISGSLVPIPLALSVILLLVSGFGRFPRMDLPSLWPQLALYALHLLGMLWTADTGFGLFDLQIKLGLVLLPLVATVVTKAFPDMLRRTMLAFTAGILIAIVLSLWKASVCFGEKGWKECWTQSYLSYDLHPSYAAWYLCWAVVYWGHQYIHDRSTERRLKRAITVVVPILLVFIVMLASKSGLVSLMVTVVFLVGLAARRLQGRVRSMVVLGSVAAVLIAGSIAWPVLKVRVGAALTAVELARAGDPAIYASSEGNEERLVAWGCSIDLLNQHPFGSGTGDIKNDLVTCYEAKGAAAAAERRLNSHDQFLQGGVALGWPGLILSLLVAIIPLVIGLHRRDGLMALFALLFALNAAVESVLEVQAGVVFFAVFIGLLAAQRTGPPE